MFEELVKKRHSVRNYSSRKIDDCDLQKILEIGRLSPTAANVQSQKNMY